jgi:hypothetical protein
MSKPSSGHFSGTTGSKNTSKNLSRNNDRSVIITPKGLDLREHPTKYKQMSSKKLKKLREKEANRTLTKAEYKHKEWQRRLNIRRKEGIDNFWEHEVERIANNRPTTRNWSAEQRADILIGKRPQYKGESMQSHHTYSVAKYPHLANLGQFIYPATRNEHKNRWHGRNFKTSLPGRPMNINIKEDF